MTVVLSAIRNASVVPVTATDVAAILASGNGVPSHVRALFGDVHVRTLERLAAALGQDFDHVLASYELARVRTCAANPDLDAIAAERDRP